MTKEKANKVYDLLVEIGGASESDRENFVYHHSTSSSICEEWRFGGKLGFGGKYRSQKNRVDCYKEDENEKTLEIINRLNNSLKEIF